MKAGIAVDDWKLPVFRRRLTEAGYTFTDAGGYTEDTTLLTIQTKSLTALRKVIEECQAECRRSKP